MCFQPRKKKQIADMMSGLAMDRTSKNCVNCVSCARRHRLTPRVSREIAGMDTAPRRSGVFWNTPRAARRMMNSISDRIGRQERNCRSQQTEIESRSVMRKLNAIPVPFHLETQIMQTNLRSIWKRLFFVATPVAVLVGVGTLSLQV